MHHPTPGSSDLLRSDAQYTYLCTTSCLQRNAASPGHQYLCLNYKAKLLRLPKGSHPAQNLIEDSAEEVYCFTEQNIRTFNRFTKSTVSDQLIFEPYTPLGQPYWFLTSPVVDLELKKTPISK